MSYKSINKLRKELSRLESILDRTTKDYTKAKATLDKIKTIEAKIDYQLNSQIKIKEAKEMEHTYQCDECKAKFQATREIDEREERYNRAYEPLPVICPKCGSEECPPVQEAETES